MKEVSNVKMMIKSYYPSLTKSEKRIADYVLANYEDIMYLSVTELAEHIKVGETTIFRFCKKIGYKGYPELKLVIAQDLVQLKEQNPDENQHIHYSESIKNRLIQKLNECFSSLRLEDIEKTIDLIIKAKRIFFLGTGSSAISAMTAKERFMRLGVTTDVATDAHRQSMVASILGKEDLIIAFSLSGATKDVVEALEIAKSNHVNTITVTSYIKSPIVEFSDIVLLTAGREHLMEGGSLVNSVSQLYIVDLITAGYADRNQKQAIEMRERTGRSILKKM